MALISDLLSNFRWIVYPSVSSLRRWWRSRTNDWVIGRVACMGQDVFKLLNVDLLMLNVQKGRVDFLIETTVNPKYRPITNKVVSFIERNDIKSLIAQQASWKWLSTRKPKALYMDSYSELTDQMFVHKIQKWSFCANYSDITHSEKFKNQFESRGLIPVEDLLGYYRRFFTIFRNQYGNIPIIFLHFPVKLDKREKFHDRYQFILKAIDQVSLEFQPFYSFVADDSIVDWPEERIPGLENFPYHYNSQTYIDLAEQIKSKGLLLGFDE